MAARWIAGEGVMNGTWRMVLVVALAMASMPREGQAAQEIGEAVAIVKVVRATLDEADRRLSASDPVRANEVISTKENSASQLKFLDDTTLTVGPNSQVVLDRFVYEPGAQNGTVVLSASRGVMRFVSGKLRKTAYQIRTPTVTIGVRGTIFTVDIAADGTTVVTVEDGSVLVDGNASAPGVGRVTVGAGLATTARPGKPPSEPGPPPVTSQTSVAQMDALIAVGGGSRASSSPARRILLIELRGETQELRTGENCNC